MNDLRELVDFVADVAPSLIPSVRAAIEDPPRDRGQVGFYLRGDEPDAELVFRFVVTELQRAELLFGFEDKYLPEMFEVLKDLELLPADFESGLDVYSEASALGEPGLFDESGPSPRLAAAYQQYADQFWTHVAALERALQANGCWLLQPHMPAGDTFFLLRVEEQVFRRWNGSVFSRHPVLSWASPDWELFWDFMSYAVRIPDEVRLVPRQ